MPLRLPPDDTPPSTATTTPSQTTAAPPHSVKSLPPAALAFAARVFDAARKGEIALFQQALPAGLPPNMTNDKGDTLIMLSAYHGHAALVSLLLSHNADPNVLNERRQSPLAGAIFKGEDEVVDLLLKGGADPDLGEPSARDAMRIFGQVEKWGERLGVGGEGIQRAAA